MRDILTLVIAFGGAAVVLYKPIKGIYKIARAIEDMQKNGQERRRENVLLIRGVLAALTGLEQLKCNGPVTEAREELQRYVIEH